MNLAADSVRSLSACWTNAKNPTGVLWRPRDFMGTKPRRGVAQFRTNSRAGALAPASWKLNPFGPVVAILPDNF